ncbi:MAG: SGNH/GDSL hydrolase family protein [Nanohaloarchaea archaeon]|nr:SGNH/GDSL hydrolase family protein [Candidatus Nanohaloarchaea archaeon]
MKTDYSLRKALLTVLVLLEVGVIVFIVAENEAPPSPDLNGEIDHPRNFLTEEKQGLVLGLRDGWRGKVDQGVGTEIPTYNVRINSEGIRDETGSLNSSKSRRIMFLGDSLTFGWGVNESDRFTDVAEIELEKSLGKNVSAANMGVPAYGLKETLQLFRRKASKFDPQTVVLNTHLEDVISYRKYDRVQETTSRTPYDIKKNFLQDFEFSGSKAQNILNTFHNISRERGFNLVMFQVRPEGRDIFRDWAVSKNVTYIEIPETLRDVSPGFWISRNDSHYNEKAHELLGEKLGKKLYTSEDTRFN